MGSGGWRSRQLGEALFEKHTSVPSAVGPHAFKTGLQKKAQVEAAEIYSPLQRTVAGRPLALVDLAGTLPQGQGGGGGLGLRCFFVPHKTAQLPQELSKSAQMA